MPKNILWKIYANMTQQYHPYSDSLSAEKTANSIWCEVSIFLYVEFQTCKRADFLPIQIILLDDLRIDVHLFTIYDHVDLLGIRSGFHILILIIKTINDSLLVFIASWASSSVAKDFASLSKLSFRLWSVNKTPMEGRATSKCSLTQWYCNDCGVSSISLCPALRVFRLYCWKNRLAAFTDVVRLRDFDAVLGLFPLILTSERLCSKLASSKWKFSALCSLISLTLGHCVLYQHVEQECRFTGNDCQIRDER